MIYPRIKKENDSIEYQKEKKIFEIKATSLKSVIKIAFEGGNFEKIGFIPSNERYEIFFNDKFNEELFATKEYFIELSLKEKESEVLFQFEFDLEKKDYDDIFSFFKKFNEKCLDRKSFKTKKINCDLFDNEELIDFIFKSEFQKYWIYTNKTDRIFYEPKKIFNKCAILDFLADIENEEENLILDNATKIKKDVFIYAELKKVQFSKNLKKIEKSAFANCVNLEEINLCSLKNLEKIGENAFFNCNLLNLNYSNEKLNLKIKDGIAYNFEETEIFYNASQKKEIFVPNSIKKIEEKAFLYAKKVSVCLETTECNQNCFGEETFIEVRDKNGKFLFEFENSITKDSVNRWILKNPNKSPSEMEILKINWATSVKNCAFEGIENLTEITLPKSIALLSKSVFYGCLNLEKINIENPECIADESCFLNTKIRNLTIKDHFQSLLKIRNGFIFSDDLKTLEYFTLAVESVVIPEGVELIGSNCFSENQTLKNVKFPSTLKSIMKNAFTGCENIEEIILPEGLISIGERSFLDCKKLRKINIPESVNFFCDECLKGTSIKNLSFKNTKIENGICYRIKKDENGNEEKIIKFATNEIDENVIFDESVVEIGGFSGNEKIKSIEIKNSKNLKIHRQAFCDCENLSSIILPKNGIFDFIDIENNAFSNCNIDNLKIISKKDNIEYIAQNGFFTKNGFKIDDSTREFLYFSNFNIFKKEVIEIPDIVESAYIDNFISNKVNIIKLPKTLKKIVFSRNRKPPIIQYSGTKEDWENVKKINERYEKFYEIQFFK